MMCSGFCGSGFQKFISVRSKASAMISSAKPNAWKVSTERAWMPSAWPISRRPSRRSIRQVMTSGNMASWAVAVMPAGPAPTTRTSMVSGSSGERSTPTPDAGSTRGSVETYPW